MTTTYSAGQAIADIDQRLINMNVATQERIGTVQARLADELDVAKSRHDAEAEAMTDRHKKELAAIRYEYQWFHHVLTEQAVEIAAARGDDTVVEFRQAAE